MLLGVLGLVTGCGSSQQAQPVTSSAPSTNSTTTSTVSAAQMSSIQANAGIPPKPDAATQQAYVAALIAIDPDIVHGKEDKAVDRGRNQCSSIKQGPGDRAKLVGLTQQRFSSPTHPEGFGEAKSAQILDVIRKHLCPTFG